MWKFTDEQFKKLADIMSDIAAISFASVALPAFTDKRSFWGVFLGLSAACIMWLSSLLIIKLANKK